MEHKFCILGNAMNAKNMELGEDISALNFAIALFTFALLIGFVLN